MNYKICVKILYEFIQQNRYRGETLCNNYPSKYRKKQRSFKESEV